MIKDAIYQKSLIMGRVCTHAEMLMAAEEVGSQEGRIGNDRMPTVDNHVVFVGTGADLCAPKWEDVYDTFVGLRKRFPRAAKRCLVHFFLEKAHKPKLCIYFVRRK